MLLSEELGRQVNVARDLKKRLIEFYVKREKKYQPILSDKFNQTENNIAHKENVIDWFLHEYRFRNGETVVDKFLAISNLTSEEGQIVRSWKKSFEGFFEILLVDTDGIEVINMFNGDKYTLVSGGASDIVKTLSQGQFILSRVEPLDSICLLTGVPHVFPLEGAEYVRRMVKDFLAKRPELALSQKNNDEQVKRYGDYYKAFVEYFGSDIIIQPGYELQDMLSKFTHFYHANVLRKTSEVMDIKFPEELSVSKQAGLICDNKTGISMYPDLAEFIAVFQNPDLLLEDRYKNIVLGYLQSAAISALPFNKMVEKYPVNAQRIFSQLFNKRKWDNKHDFLALIQQYKASR